MIPFRLKNVKIDFETAEVFQMHLFVFSTVDFIGVPATGMLPPSARPPKDPDEDGEGDEGVDHRTRQPISPPVQRRVLHTRRSRREDPPGKRSRTFCTKVIKKTNSATEAIPTSQRRIAGQMFQISVLRASSRSNVCGTPYRGMPIMIPSPPPRRQTARVTTSWVHRQMNKMVFMRGSAHRCVPLPSRKPTAVVHRARQRVQIRYSTPRPAGKVFLNGLGGPETEPPRRPTRRRWGAAAEIGSRACLRLAVRRCALDSP